MMTRSLPNLAPWAAALLLAAVPEAAAAQPGFGPLSRLIGVESATLDDLRGHHTGLFAQTGFPIDESPSPGRVFVYTTVGATIPIAVLAGLFYAAGDDDEGEAVGVSDATAALVLSSSILTVAAAAIRAGGSRRRAVIGSFAGFLGALVGVNAVGTSGHTSLIVPVTILSHAGIATLVVTF